MGARKVKRGTVTHTTKSVASGGTTKAAGKSVKAKRPEPAKTNRAQASKTTKVAGDDAKASRAKTADAHQGTLPPRATPTKQATIRAFVALDLDPTSVRRVARVSDRLRMGSGAPSASWTPREKMHVTLKFAGELPVDAVAPIGAGLDVLARGKKAPRPVSFRLSAFPSLADAHTIVAELADPDGELASLAARIDALVHEHGVARDRRSFRPHVTLARLKRPYDTRRWLRPELADGAGTCVASRVTLYRSDPGVEGSTYVALASFDLAVDLATI